MTKTGTAPAHTAGSWYILPIQTGDKLRPFTVCTESPDDDGGDIVCDILALRNAEGNARLIAIAPALLQACRDLVGAMHQLDKGHHAEVARAESILAQASSPLHGG